MDNIGDIKVIKNLIKDTLEDGPIIPRCYEVNYLKEDQYFNVRISKFDLINKGRGEWIRGRWYYENNKYILFLETNIDGNENAYDKVKERNKYIRFILPKVIESIRNGDANLFKRNNYLENAEVFIKFKSRFDDFYKVENWGVIKYYKDINNKIKESKNIQDSQREKALNKNYNLNYNQFRLQQDILISSLNHHIETFLISSYGTGIANLIKEIKLIDLKEVKRVDSSVRLHEVIALVKILENNKEEEISLKIDINPKRIIINKL